MQDAIELTKLAAVDRDVFRQSVLTHKVPITYRGQLLTAWVTSLLDQLRSDDPEHDFEYVAYDVKHQRLVCVTDLGSEVNVTDGLTAWTKHRAATRSELTFQEVLALLKIDDEDDLIIFGEPDDIVCYEGIVVPLLDRDGTNFPTGP